MRLSPSFVPASLALILGLGLLHTPLRGAPPEPPTKAKAEGPASADQSKPGAMVMPADPAKGDPTLGPLVAQLQAKVEKLEAALAKSAPKPAASAAPAMAGMPAPVAASAAPMPGMAAAPPAPMNMMGMMGQMMGMMDKMMGMGGAMPPATPAPKPMPMPMGMEMMGMMGMGPMPADPAAIAPSSALPGFPGASHLYHIGATGFFLDHPEHITLTTAQQAGLNKAKEQTLLARSTGDRAAQQAEQDLWTLTAADQPDAAKIKAKIAEIGKLSADARFAFINAVGEASKLLTDEQRKILSGFMPPVPAAPAPMAAPAAGPTPAAPMKDM